MGEPAQETMITEGQESCLHTPVWGVEGFNISTSEEVEGELTTGKQLTRVFNGLVEENTTDDTAMTNTINFDDLPLEETVFVSTSIAPMDMIEEEENLMIEKNTVPLSEDTTNIMEMIENAAFDFTLPEPLPTTTLHITDHKAEVEQMVEVNDTAETFSTWTSLDDANLGLCLPALLATMWSQAKRTTCSSGSWTTTRLPTSTSQRGGGGHHKLPHRGGEGGGDKGQQEKSGQDGGVDGGGEVQEDEGAEQQGQPGLQGEEEEEAGRGGAGVDHLAGEEHPPAGCFQEHAGRGGPVQEKDPRAGFRSEKLKYNRSR